MDPQEGPVFEKALRKWYLLAGMDAGLSDECAADLAYELIIDWRWDLAVVGEHVGVGAE